MRPTVPDELLKALRTIGDPDLDVAGTQRKDLPQVSYVEPTMAVTKTHRSMVASVTPAEPPVELHAERLLEAQDLFRAYATEIGGALVLAALPQSYATAWGARVLWANAQLEHDLIRRISRTARFVMDVAQHGGAYQGRLWDPRWTRPSELAPEPLAAPPWWLCVNLRLIHQAVRDKLRRKQAADAVEEPVVPTREVLGGQNVTALNQEDLLAMLLTFSVTTFEVLEKYGISWTVDQQESFLHLWDVVGAYLGIGVGSVITRLNDEGHPLPVDLKWVGLRPVGVEDTRRLLAQMRARQWVVLDRHESDDGPEVLPGRVLTKALLDELAKAMPVATQRLPLAVMRALAPDVVRDRLNLGGGGVLMRLIEQLPRRRVLTGRFSQVWAPNPRGARVLRFLGNDVSARTTLRFMQEVGFEIPGLVSGLPRPL